MQDGNGNPLVSGTRITASVDNGSLSGDTSVTIPDTQSNTNYSVTWTNNITGTENKTGILTITVSSTNGDVMATRTRTLIRPVAVSISTSAPIAGDTVTVTPSGGSETVDSSGTANYLGGYTITHADRTDACSYGSSVQYTAGNTDDKETVTVWDDVTGEYAVVSYTVQ